MAPRDSPLGSLSGRARGPTIDTDVPADPCQHRDQARRLTRLGALARSRLGRLHPHGPNVLAARSRCRRAALGRPHARDDGRPRDRVHVAGPGDGRLRPDRRARAASGDRARAGRVVELGPRPRTIPRGPAGSRPDGPGHRGGRWRRRRHLDTPAPADRAADTACDGVCRDDARLPVGGGHRHGGIGRRARLARAAGRCHGPGDDHDR